MQKLDGPQALAGLRSQPSEISELDLARQAKRSAMIADRIELLFSAYRRDDYADPERFVTQLGVVLTDYSDDIIQYVTDPRTGIQRRIKWPPSIPEIVEACDERKKALEKSAELEVWKAKMERAREERLTYGRSTDLPGITYGEFLARFPDQRPIGFFENEVK